MVSRIEGSRRLKRGMSSVKFGNPVGQHECISFNSEGTKMGVLPAPPDFRSYRFPREDRGRKAKPESAYFAGVVIATSFQYRVTCHSIHRETMKNRFWKACRSCNLRIGMERIQIGSDSIDKCLMSGSREIADNIWRF